MVTLRIVAGVFLVVVVGVTWRIVEEAVWGTVGVVFLKIAVGVLWKIAEVVTLLIVVAVT